MQTKTFKVNPAVAQLLIEKFGGSFHQAEVMLVQASATGTLVNTATGDYTTTFPGWMDENDLEREFAEMIRNATA